MVMFSEEAKSLHASDIREILKVTENPEIISFAGGLPAPELFPIDEMMKVDVEILKKEGRQAVQYSTTEGYIPLRKQIAARMKSSFHTDCTYEDIIITAGSQQGLSLLGQLFLNEGDVVLVESPTYMGATTAFAVNFPQFVEVETDDKGMVPEALEKAIEKYGDRVRLMYVIPEFQNPTGITWPLERRKAVMDIMNKHDIPVIEDDPYGELRYEGQTMPTLKSMDTKGNVIFLGSFSKIFMPGLRIGWMVAHHDILEKAVMLKQTVDLQSSSFAQRQASYYIDMYDLDAHVAKIRELYGKRRTLMYDSMKKYFPQGLSFTYPEGGLFTMAFLPDGMDSQPFVREAIQRGVLCVPGSAFLADEKQVSNAFRLNYSTPTDEQIVKGIEILGKLTHEWIKE